MLDNTELQTFNITDLADSAWFENKEQSLFWLRMYTTFPVPTNKINDYFKNALRKIDDKDQPIKIHYLAIESLKLAQIQQNFPYSHPDTGEMVIKQKVKEQEFPKCSYIFFVCPLKIDSSGTQVFETERHLDITAAIFSLYVGNNLLREVVYDGVFNVNNNAQSIAGPVIKTLRQSEGPFLHDNNWKGIEEIYYQLSNLTDEDAKRRIELALSYFYKGKIIINEEEKFFFYWTALTILSGSKTMIINEKLQKIYSVDKETVEKMGWKKIYEMRNNFFKKGVTPIICSDIERYFQLLFLDLLRYELNLEKQNHIPGILKNSKNFNLDTILLN